MKTTITAKLKLHTSPEQFAQLRRMQLAYRDALNYVSRYAYAHGKISNKVALQDGTYNEIRTRFHLPSQMACNVCREVGATYKGLWTKAPLHESIAIKVDADYTSKGCPMCGHTCDANRPNKGLLFICQNCYYTLHADLVGARNITMRTLLVQQDWIRTGQLSVVPESSDSDVSSLEAKAARLRQYAELRWSLDTRAVWK